jgi:pimeloyl-ACP methyl ester carboxylesterase
LAQDSQNRGRAVSARDSYLRASNYWRAAYTFLIGPNLDPRVAHAYRRQRAAFEAAVSLMRPSAERVSIPYETGALHGYFFPGGEDGARRLTLIINGGYDSTAEECFFFSGAAAVARGYNCLVFDGPGQGAAIVEDRLVFRPDWEAVIEPVVTFAVARPEVDPKKIALMGISFGGYLAPRAASAEPRLAALIADPGEYDLLDEMKSRTPPFIARALPDGDPLVLMLLNLIPTRRMRHLTAGWGLRRGLWLHGLKSPLAYMRATAAYTSKGLVSKIRCPTLICRAENDDIGVTAHARYKALACPKHFLTFTAKDGAGEHCEAGARALFNQRAFDWLDDVLAANQDQKDHAG